MSVTMTALSTLLAVFLTPLIISTLGGEFLEVNAGDMFLSVVKIVLLPVTTGFTIRFLFREKVQGFLDIFPAISVAVIVLIIATIVALSHEKLPEVISEVSIGHVEGMGVKFSTCKVFFVP
ncbi:MAG: bile acid:sodium symporter, partial [Algicola sp.]|nr:bile acid:sodium symporter [Algicola sp.]